MTSEEHAAEAERLMVETEAEYDPGSVLLYRAQVHAQLAAARATQEQTYALIAGSGQLARTLPPGLAQLIGSRSRT